jgi:hypothetical protein
MADRGHAIERKVRWRCGVYSAHSEFAIASDVPRENRRLDVLHRARQHSLDVLMHFRKGAVASRLDTPWRVIKI